MINNYLNLKMNPTEFNDYVKKVNILREKVLQISENRETPIMKTATDLIEEQSSCLESSNNFFLQIADNLLLEERLDCRTNTILMPDRDSAKNLVEIVKKVYDIFQEVARSKKQDSSSPVDKQFLEEQKNNLNRFSYCDCNNEEFNRHYRVIMKYFNVKSHESEEFGDSTINTIISDDVTASSPI